MNSTFPFNSSKSRLLYFGKLEHNFRQCWDQFWNSRELLKCISQKKNRKCRKIRQKSLIAHLTSVHRRTIKIKRISFWFFYPMGIHVWLLLPEERFGRNCGSEVRIWTCLIGTVYPKIYIIWSFTHPYISNLYDFFLEYT